MDENKFHTSNLDLAAFLLLSGEEFTKLLPSQKSRHVVLMEFEDPIGKCLDLERVFINSEFAKYRQLQRWLLKQIKQRLNK